MVNNMDTKKNRKVVQDYFLSKCSTLEAKQRTKQFFDDNTKLDQEQVKEILDLLDSNAVSLKAKKQFSRIIIQKGQLIELQ